MARHGNRPIQVGVNIQKKVFRLSQAGTPSKIAPHNSKQLHECEVRVTRIATPHYKYSNFILFCKIFLKNKSKKFLRFFSGNFPKIILIIFVEISPL